MASPYYSIPGYSVPDNIIKKLILLYGFNFGIQKKTNLRFAQLKEPLFENYYIINSDWINKFKDFYNYEGVSKLITQYNFQYHDYTDFENNIDNTMKTIKAFGINQKGHNFTNEVNEKFSFLPLKIQTNINALTYFFSDFYIVNEKIIDELLLEKGENPIIKNISNYKFCISKYSFFYHNNEFEIGIINKEGIFTPQYHVRLVNVNENINPENEIRTILKLTNLDKYFEYRKINKEDLVQIINDSNFGNIGTILNIVKYKEKQTKEQKPNNQINQSQIINNQNNVNLYNNNNNENNFIQLKNGQIVNLNEYIQTNELLKNNNVITDIKKHNQIGTIYQTTNLENTSAIFSQKSNKQSFNNYTNNINIGVDDQILNQNNQNIQNTNNQNNIK